MNSSSLVALKYPVVGRAEAIAKPHKLPMIRAEQVKIDGRRAAMISLATTLFASAAVVSSASAGALADAIERTQANKALNDKKRLATSGANFARAYTVQFGTCKFPENFTGCQDLAKQKKVPFLSDDIDIECEGKDKYQCGSNVFWKW